MMEQVNHARRALAEVETVEDALRVADYAESIRYAARQARAGMEAENFAAEVRLRAERRAGELLSQTEKHVGGRPSETGRTVLPVYTPKLADLGVTKSASSRYQQVADVPPEVFEDYIAAKQERGEEITTNRLLRLAREAPKDVPEPDEITTAGSAEIRHGDLRVTLNDLTGQVDAIITDPPYPAEFLDEYDALGELASRILKPGGLAVVMVGPTHLPEYLRRLMAHIPYRWCGAYLMDGPAARVHGRKVGTKWKPLLIFGGSQFITQDVFQSRADDKQHHKWGQSESGMADIVSRLTNPGELVVDPFLGGGTTAVVCRDLGRRFVGCDIDPQAITTTLERLA
jgi:hypothetical protein